MAFEKKPSSNPDRGRVRSAEELETYGVWVKSGPQDIASDIAGAVNYDEDAVPFDADFDMGFSGMGPNGGGNVRDAAFESFADGSFVAGGFSDANFAGGGFPSGGFAQGDFPRAAAPSGPAENDGFGNGDFAADSDAAPRDDVSSRLLLKIADELSSIRADIDTLKKEFAGMRSGGSDEARDGKGFFSGDDDGKIALTDNEMDNILASSGLTPERDAFDSFRDADEAALRELSLQNEAAEAGGPAYGDDDGFGFGTEPDGSPFDDGLSSGAEEADMRDRFREPDDVFDTDLEFLTGGAEADGMDLSGNDIFRAFADELPSADTLEDVDELRELRMHGADPLTPPPEDTSYLEEEPFHMTNAEEEGLSDDGDVFGDVDRDGFEFGAFGSGNQENLDDASDDGVSLLNEVPYTDDVSDDDGPYPEDGELTVDDGDLSFIDGIRSPDDDLPTEDGEPAMDDGDLPSIGGIPSPEDDELAPEDDDVAAPEDGDLPSIGGIPSMDDDDDLSLDDGGLSLDEDYLSPFGAIPSDDDEFSVDGEMSLEEGDMLLGGGGLTFDDDEMTPEDGGLVLEDDDELSLDDDGIALDDETLPEDGGPIFGDDGIALDDDGITLGDDGITLDDNGITPEDDINLPPWLISESETAEIFDAASPEDGEPAPDGTFDESSLENISLEMDDFEIDDLDTEDSNIVRVIPEGFNVGDEEPLVSFDDDLEAIADEDEEAPPPKSNGNGRDAAKTKTGAGKTGAGKGGDADISPDLKGDLKNVLAYMDQLLESLPEDKIEEFAKSEHFDTYKKLFKELGLV